MFFKLWQKHKKVFNIYGLVGNKKQDELSSVVN